MKKWPVPSLCRPSGRGYGLVAGPFLRRGQQRGQRLCAPEDWQISSAPRAFFSSVMVFYETSSRVRAHTSSTHVVSDPVFVPWMGDYRHSTSSGSTGVEHAKVLNVYCWVLLHKHKKSKKLTKLRFRNLELGGASDTGVKQSVFGRHCDTHHGIKLYPVVSIGIKREPGDLPPW